MEIQKSIQKEDIDKVFSICKNRGAYKKISKSSLKLLEKVFEKKPYPSTDEIQSLASIIQEKEIKVQNWFKSRRKKDFLTNQKVIKKYKKNHIFSQKEKEFLEKAFREQNELTNSYLEEINKTLKCEPHNIKRWFYYRKRKLQRVIESKKNKTKTAHSSKSSEQKTPQEDDPENEGKTDSNNPDTFISLSRLKTNQNSSSEQNSYNEALIYSNLFQNANNMNFLQRQEPNFTPYTSSNSHNKSSENVFRSMGGPHQFKNIYNSEICNNERGNNMLANYQIINNFMGSSDSGNNIMDQSQKFTCFANVEQRNSHILSNILPTSNQSFVNFAGNPPFTPNIYLNQQNSMVRPLFIQTNNDFMANCISQEANNNNNIYFFIPGNLQLFHK